MEQGKAISFFDLSGRQSYQVYVLNLSLAFLFLMPLICFYVFQKSIFFCQENNSLFVYSFDYFLEFAGKPGGLLEYAGIFFTQVYFDPVCGALVISMIFVSLGKALFEVQKALNINNPFSAILVVFPLCLLMLLQKSFEHSVQQNLGFLLVILVFLLYIRLAKRFRILIPAFFPLLFYLAGSFSFICQAMFVVYCLVYIKGILKYTLPLILIVSTSMAFVFFREVLFLQPAGSLVHYPIQKYASTASQAIFFLLCGYFVLFPFLLRVNRKITPKIPLIIPAAVILILFTVTGFLLTKPADPVLADITMTERDVHDLNWDAIIRKHESSPSTNITGQYYYNLALSETDQLCNRLFEGRQDFGAGSLVLPRDDKNIDREIYYYYAIGLSGEAHHLATESLVKNGYRPEILKILIKTEIINGNYKIAEKFLNVLRRTLHYRKWAYKYIRILDDSLIFSDPEISKKTGMLPKADFFIRPVDSLNIESILRSDPGNRTAFEYKMARLMLEKDLKSVVREAGKMKENGYTYYPRYIQEAIMEETYLGNELECSGLVLPDSVISAFRLYRNEYDSYSKSDKSQLEEKMKGSWGDTYWYYYDFR
jgi:hypothetical protein